MGGGESVHAPPGLREGEMQRRKTKGGNHRGESEKELVRDAEGLIIKGRSMK